MKKLSLIILTYNSEKDIYDCLNSVYKYNDIGDYLEIIVVDNNSDNYIQMQKNIMTQYPDVQIIANHKNGGYGQGNNLGIRAASAPIVSIMNPDVRLIMPVFQQFIDVLSQTKNIMCGGKQYATLNQVNPSFYYDFTESGIRQSIGRIICHKLDIYTQKRMWLQGAFFAIKKDIFEQIGLFDETLFMYAEEFDIHLRIKRYLSTYNIIYLPQLKYLHLTSNRGFSAECIKKQYNADIYVCKKHGLSIHKMLQNIQQAHTIGCIISSLITKKTNRNIDNQIVQKQILKDLMEKYK